MTTTETSARSAEEIILNTHT